MNRSGRWVLVSRIKELKVPLNPNEPLDNIQKTAENPLNKDRLTNENRSEKTAAEKNDSENMVSLTELAEVIRSKNAGPYELTLDIIFKTQEIYDKVVKSKQITPQKIADLYSIPIEKIISFVEFAPAKAIKITMERPGACGDIGDNDVYGAQQHAPLLLMKLPWS